MQPLFAPHQQPQHCIRWYHRGTMQSATASICCKPHVLGHLMAGHMNKPHQPPAQTVLASHYLYTHWTSKLQNNKLTRSALRITWPDSCRSSANLSTMMAQKPKDAWEPMHWLDNVGLTQGCLMPDSPQATQPGHCQAGGWCNSACSPRISSYTPTYIAKWRNKPSQLTTHDDISQTTRDTSCSQASLPASQALQGLSL